MRLRLLTMALVSFLALPRADAKDLEIHVAADSYSQSEAIKFNDHAADLATKTAARVKLDFVEGAKDADLAARLAAGTIDGCVLNAAGLHLIIPDSRVFALPMLFASEQELDAGRAAIQRDLDAVLAGAGYLSLGWVDDGQIRLFSNVEITSLAVLRKAKVGVAADDRVMITYLKHLGVSPVTFKRDLDLFTKIDNGDIDAVHATAMVGAMSMLAYVATPPIAWTTGAFLVRRDVFDALSATDQQALRDMARDMTTIQRSHMRTVKVRASRNGKDSKVVESRSQQLLVDLWQFAAEDTWTEYAGNLYDIDLLNTILATAGKPELDTSTVPARVVAIKPTVARPASARVVYRGDGTDEALTAALDDAPEDLRALRLAIDDCDAEMMSDWIRFPLRVGSAQYKDAADLAKACATDTSLELDAAELESKLRDPSLSGTDLRLRIDGQDWRFVWSGRQWWLTEVAAAF